MEKIKNKLLTYQVQHTENLVRIIKDNNACLDASDTGTGKTYCAIAACNILKLTPIIICPIIISSTVPYCKRIKPIQLEMIATKDAKSIERYGLILSDILPNIGQLIIKAKRPKMLKNKLLEDLTPIY